MAEVIFKYKGKKTIIRCGLNDTIETIINYYLIINKNKENDSFYYLYNGKHINKKLKFIEQATYSDKKMLQMYIYVSDKQNQEDNIIGHSNNKNNKKKRKCNV